MSQTAAHRNHNLGWYAIEPCWYFSDTRPIKLRLAPGWYGVAGHGGGCSSTEPLH